MARETHDRHIVAVFESESDADAAAAELRRRGINGGRLEVDDPAVDVESLRAEMQAETTDSWVSPQGAFVLPKEGKRGFLLVLPFATLLGAIIGLPFGFLSNGDDVVLWQRLLIAAAIGAAGGAVVGALWGAARGARGPAAPLAVEKGISLRVDAADEQTLDILRAHHPIRADVLDADGRLVERMDVNEHRVQDTVDRLQQAVEEPEGDWSRVQKA